MSGRVIGRGDKGKVEAGGEGMGGPAAGGAGTDGAGLGSRGTGGAGTGGAAAGGAGMGGAGVAGPGAVAKHGTSSVFVFCRQPPGWRIGLIRHPLFGRMMMPGGHIEDVESPGEAALREVAEEAGLAVRLLSPPAAPLPDGYCPPRVAHPWWIVEYEVPPDNHLAHPHIHVDHLYVAVTGGPHPGRPPEHPFGWYAAGDLAGLPMFDDARLLASALLAALSSQAAGPAGQAGGAGTGNGEPSVLAAAIVAGLAAQALP